MFSLAFSSLGSPYYDVDQLIAMAVDNGYTGVELRFVRGEVDLTRLEEFSERNLEATRRHFDDAGVKVVCLDSSVHMASLDPQERAAQLRNAEDYARIAAGLGAPYIRVFGWDTPEGQDPDATFRGIADGLSDIAERTAALGVTSLIETHDSFSTASSVRRLLDAGVSDWLGVLWDTYHTFRFGESVQESWDLVGDRVHHVHMKDARTASPDEPFEGVLTGEGVTPIAEIVGVLEAGGYDEVVSFEWEKYWFPELAEPEVAIPQFARYLAGLSAR